jgi:hypothetical protein
MSKRGSTRVCSVSLWSNGTTTDISNPELTEILQKHVFVGIVDLVRELSVVQVSTKLYLVNHGALA